MPLNPVKIGLLGQSCHEYIIAKLKHDIDLDNFERIVRKNCLRVLDSKEDNPILDITSKDAKLIECYTSGTLHKKIKFLANLSMAHKLYQCQDCLELIVTDDQREHAYTLNKQGIYRNKDGFFRITGCEGQ